MLLVGGLGLRISGYVPHREPLGQPSEPQHVPADPAADHTRRQRRSYRCTYSIFTAMLPQCYTSISPNIKYLLLYTITPSIPTATLPQYYISPNIKYLLFYTINSSIPTAILPQCYISPNIKINITP